MISLYTTSTIFTNHTRHHDHLVRRNTAERKNHCQMTPHSHLDTNLSETVNKLQSRSTIPARNQERLACHAPNTNNDAHQDMVAIQEGGWNLAQQSTIARRNQRRAMRWM